MKYKPFTHFTNALNQQLPLKMVITRQLPWITLKTTRESPECGRLRARLINRQMPAAVKCSKSLLMKWRGMITTIRANHATLSMYNIICPCLI